MGVDGEMLAEAPRECVVVGVADTRVRDGVKNVGVTDGVTLEERLVVADGDNTVALTVDEGVLELVRVAVATDDRDTLALCDMEDAADEDRDALTEKVG